MPLNFFKPRPGRFGTQIAFLSLSSIGGADYIGGAAPLTVNDTTTFKIPSPYRKCRFVRASVVMKTIAVDADGTVLATVKKLTAPSTKASLTDALSWEAAGVTADTVAQFVTLSTATEAQRTLNAGESFIVDVVNDSAAIDTQPAGINITIEVEVLE